MTSLDAFRAYQRSVWFPAVRDGSRVEAYIRDLVITQPDGTVRSVMSDSAAEAQINALLADRRDYTKVHSPALAIYAETIFDMHNGDAALLAANVAWEHKYFAPFRAASIERVRRELGGVEMWTSPSLLGSRWPASCGASSPR
jgi:hypothetical protein